jgi:hypothetical protein
VIACRDFEKLSLRALCIFALSALKGLFQRRGRRDTQRAAEKKLILLNVADSPARGAHGAFERVEQHAVHRA